MTMIDLICSLTPTEADAVKAILEELQRAKDKWPNWLDDPIHAAGVLCEEAGETMQAALDMTYSGGQGEAVKTEAAQTGAMAIRLIAGLGKSAPHQHYRGEKA